jgi:hypothetical protein
MIELDSIQEQELSKLSGFAVNPKAQRVGYSNKKQYKLERDLSLAVIKGKSDILWLADRYAKSYSSSRLPTLNQYKDYLTSLLLVEFVRDTQYYYNSASLTQHSIKTWLEYDYKQIWPFIADNTSIPDIYGWGPLGSLSFYTYFSPSRFTYNEANWNQVVEDCLQLIWLSVGQSFSIRDDIHVFNNRLKKYLLTVGLTDDLVSLLDILFEETYKQTAVTRRRSGLTLDKLDLVKQRLLFSEYPDDLYTTSLLYASAQLQEDFKAVRKKVLASLKPSGARLLLQAIVVECLYRCVLELSQLADVWKDQPLVNYAKYDSYTRYGANSVRETLAKCWVIISDAQYLQRLFNTPSVEYKESSNLYLWKSCSPDLDTSLGAPFRLTAFL